MEENQTENLMTNKDVMDFLQVNEKTLREYREKYGLPFYKINNRTFRYEKKKIIEWLEMRSNSNDE